MPNSKFPNMREMTDKIHSFGLKCGIYSTPMLEAWGCPAELKTIPGCTQGEPDYRFAPINGGIGVIHKEKNNARQWEAWGFDYLKYDWAPTDPVNADLMRCALASLNRDFGFCVTVKALKEYSNYWSKYCNSYRSNPDTYCNFQNLVEIYESYFDFREFACKGHYFDLDMLDFGTCKLHTLWNTLTNDEKIIEFSMRAFLNSPIQISSTLEVADSFELSVYCNDEILAINQDCAFKTPNIITRFKEKEAYLDILEKELEDGKYAYAIFNLGATAEQIKILADDTCIIRDAWAKENIGCGNMNISVQPHTVKIIKSSTKIDISRQN
jgi:alpha-galactosidase